MEYVLETSEGDLEFTLLRKKIKNIRIRVTGSGCVAVSAPLHVAQRRIEHFVLQNATIIKRQQQRIEEQRRRSYPAKYKNGDAFRFLGQPTILNLKTQKSESAVLEAGILTLHVPENKSAKQIFEKWMMRAAREVFAQRLCVLSGKFTDADVRLAVRNMLTRWGSINTKRYTMNLTVHLARCEPELIDYVITHELCHIAHMHHTKAFYRQLETHFPGHRQYDKKLLQYGLVDF